MREWYGWGMKRGKGGEGVKGGGLREGRVGGKEVWGGKEGRREGGMEGGWEGGREGGIKGGMEG